MSKVTVDMDGIAPKWAKKFDQRAAALTEQVLADSTRYVPVRSGDLRNSGRKESRPGYNVVEWNTPYARAQYYGYPNKSKTPNPMATSQWFEKAKAAKLSLWRKMAGDL